MSALWFVVLIGVLIFVHELGHFVFAKAFGVKVLRFSLGFGPTLARIQRGETEYVIAWLPLGGFVSMLGSDPTEEIPEADRHRAYFARPLPQRFLIALAGPLFNLVFPVAIYFVFFYSHATLPPAAVGAVFPNTPAARAGLQPGDRIVELDGRPIRYWSDLQGTVSEAAGQELRVTLERDGEKVVTTLVPDEHEVVSRLGRRRKIGRIGVGSQYLGSQVGVLGSSSPAGLAGLQTRDRVTAADGKPITRWFELERRFRKAAGRPITLDVSRAASPPPSEGDGEAEAPASNHRVTLEVPSDGRLASAGVFPGDAFVAEVEAGSPAAAAGLEVGDMLVATDQVVCPTWGVCLEWMLRQPDDPHVVAYISHRAPEHGLRYARIDVEVRSELGDYKEEQRIPVVGIRNRSLLIPETPVENEDRLAYAVVSSVEKNLEVVAVTLYGFLMIVRGDISTKSLGGPIMIYNIAGRAAEKGWEEFLWVMALISINLGIINLLPIPMLDGGHLVFVVIEAVKRGPISLRTRAVATYFGLSLLIFLMLFAFKNDLERYWDDITSVFR